MIAYLLLGAAILIGSLLIARWYVTSEPQTVVRVLRWTLAIVGLALAVVIVLGGARYLLAFIWPLFIPLLLRSRLLLDRLKAAYGPTQGQSSTVETRFLRMTLDHDSGAMEGVVREGRFRGQRLHELDESELIELWRDCRAEDEQSAAVLEAYLDRAHGVAWREAAGAPQAEDASAGDEQAAGRPGESTMSRDEAFEILGLSPGASEREIRAAHHRLMQQFHPDHGGSNYLASKINQAKQVLLGK
jgi:hypothetical protein